MNNAHKTGWTMDILGSSSAVTSGVFMETSPTISVEIIGVEGGVSGTEVGAINFSASAANRPVNY